MVKDSKPELLKRMLLQTALTDISTENTPGEGACHIHVLRFKSIRREKLLPTKDEYCPRPPPPRMYQDLLEVCSKSHIPYFECISAFKRSSVVVLLQWDDGHFIPSTNAISVT